MNTLLLCKTFQAVIWNIGMDKLDKNSLSSIGKQTKIKIYIILINDNYN